MAGKLINKSTVPNPQDAGPASRWVEKRLWVRGRPGSPRGEESGLCEEQLRETADAYCQQWKLRDTGVLEEVLMLRGDETPVPQPCKPQGS